MTSGLNQTKTVSLQVFKQQAIPRFNLIQLSSSGSLLIDSKSQSYFINDVFHSISGSASILPFTSQGNYTGSSVIVTAANSNTALLGAQTGLKNYITSIGVAFLGSGST